MKRKAKRKPNRSAAVQHVLDAADRMRESVDAARDLFKAAQRFADSTSDFLTPEEYAKSRPKP